MSGPIDRGALDDQATYRVVSNFTAIAEYGTVREAKARALAESIAYEDCVIVELGSTSLYLARYGRLYRLAATR